MRLSKARKVLGKMADNLTNSEIEKEIELATMIAEMVLKEYKDLNIKPLT